MKSIPVMRPRLPRAESYLPLLKQIDENRVYGNFGPMVLSFQDRLCEHFGVGQGSLITVANATLGLALALQAQSPPAGSLCVMPAWTFVASAHAARIAGLVPYFVDVDPLTWSLDPNSVEEYLASAPSLVGAIMPVVPFGRPIDMAAWQAVREGTKLAVVVDAAAGFDSLRPGGVPAVVSLHATKSLGVGEGGFVVGTDTELIAEVRARSNFGFVRSREAEVLATNAKLSEYHAAVGLASLDEWTQARAEWMEVAESYIELSRPLSEISFQDGFGKGWVSSTCNVCIPRSRASGLESKMHARHIDTRSWWGGGAHIQAAFADAPRAALDHTEVLGQTTIGLPFYRDLGTADIERVVSALAKVVQL